jgi:hypothetical protein
MKHDMTSPAARRAAEHIIQDILKDDDTDLRSKVYGYLFWMQMLNCNDPLDLIPLLHSQKLGSYKEVREIIMDLVDEDVLIHAGHHVAQTIKLADYDGPKY